MGAIVRWNWAEFTSVSELGARSDSGLLVMQITTGSAEALSGTLSASTSKHAATSAVRAAKFPFRDSRSSCRALRRRFGQRRLGSCTRRSDSTYLHRVRISADADTA